MHEPSKSGHEKFNLRTKEALLDKIRELRLEIPFSDDVGALLAPIAIQGKTVRNRLAVQPMEGADGDDQGAPGPLTFRRYKRFAGGGSGLIWFEACAVSLDCRSNPRQLCLTRANLDAFKRLVEETRSAAYEKMGPHHDVLLVLQLTHPGRYCRCNSEPRPVLVRQNPVLDEPQGIPVNHALVTDQELERLQHDFLEAAQLAAEAGFDGVDVKACHGYLVSELLASSGRKNSLFGGSFENRTRFLLDVVRRIRDELPECIAGVRLNGYDGLANGLGFGTNAEDPSSEDLAEPMALAGALRDTGCALLNVTAGIPYANAHVSRPFDIPAVGGSTPSEHPLEGVARLIRIAGAVQRSTPGLPVVGTGYSWLRHQFPHVGAAVIKAGNAAFIGAGRAAFAYPDFAKELMDTGALDPERCCIGCSRCTQIMRDGGSTGCVVRDRDTYLPIFRNGRKGKEG